MRFSTVENESLSGFHPFTGKNKVSTFNYALVIVKKQGRVPLKLEICSKTPCHSNFISFPTRSESSWEITWQQRTSFRTRFCDIRFSRDTPPSFLRPQKPQASFGARFKSRKRSRGSYHEVSLCFDPGGDLRVRTSSSAPTTCSDVTRLFFHLQLYRGPKTTRNVSLALSLSLP